jgi:hypothetical protein
MANITIFKQGDLPSTGQRQLSELGKSLAAARTSRRVQTNTNGTFKRIINGEQVGNAVRGEINVIVVAALPRVSRVYYKGKYDPNAKPALPDCWSNLGDRPETAAPRKQHTNCADCSKNVKGSGDNGGRACRYQRRIAILLENDPSGDVYQFNVPAKSLFGKGVGNVHPFESYIKYLIAHGESPDTVVTNISYNLNADSMELLFTPQRTLSDEEYALVQSVQANPEARNYTMLTVSQADGVTAPSDDAEDAPEEVKPAKPAKPATIAFSDEPDDEEEEVVAAPVKRQTRRAAPPPAEKRDLSDVLDQWGDE